MKEFSKTQKVTYNLMSFTGFKALLIFSMLVDGPKSYEEISFAIENTPYFKEKISIDTLRVYINSLKRIGCEVKRVKGEDKISKYVITSHPFDLKIPTEQIQTITKVYKTLVKSMDIEDILFMYKFLEKICNYIKNEDFIYTVKNLSMLKDINIEILKELINCCNQKAEILISYNSPSSGLKDMKINVEKIEILNGKIYLSGYGLDYGHKNNFPVSRIKSIKEINPTDTQTNKKNILTVTYELETINGNFDLADYEKIIKQKDNKAVIEAKTSNLFFFKQRLLQYGPQCKIIAPDEFKNDFIQLLKNMQKEYYCD